EIVEALDRFIVGQDAAKRAVAIAVRNRWRRQQLPESMRADVSPKNILMIGSTGVGKTEIARRLAKLTGAPFIKVEATKYTEVGYYGRDVESMVRDLLENSITLVRSKLREEVREDAEARTVERLLDLLCPKPPAYSLQNNPEEIDGSGDSNSYDRTRQKMAGLLAKGSLDDRKVELSIEQKATPVMLGGGNIENMDVDFQNMLEKIMPRNRVVREMDVKSARRVIFEQECDALLDEDKVNQAAIELAENMGIIFVDEIDKVIASDSKGADVSRQGVQRDLLPIVEGTTVHTKHGYIKTDHVLFIAAGAFHKNLPSDLMPELQGRFPIRVELNDLTVEDFVRILHEPEHSLVKQYGALLQTENIRLTFTSSAIEEIARVAFQVNQSSQNIGARRLYTVLEHLLEELSFEAPQMSSGPFEITLEYVQQKLESVSKNEDLSKFIL
ncbi:MAG: ATP-dependent protease ATPase subunit HslU, partial [Pirellulaceae bacterium]